MSFKSHIVYVTDHIVFFFYMTQKILLDNRCFAWNLKTNEDGTQTIEEIPSFTVEKVKKSSTPKMADLPLDIVNMVLQYQIDWCIRQGLFTQAFGIISLSKAMVTRYYKMYCNVDIADRISVHETKLASIYWIFQFAGAIFEDSLNQRNGLQSHTFFFDISTNWKFQDVSCSPHKIYNKFDFNVMELGDFDRIIDPPQDLLALSQGERYIDVIWFTGQYDTEISSIYHYTLMERPVIVLSISDATQKLLSVKRMKKIQGWKEFMKLLKEAGGKQTGIYVIDHCTIEGEYVIKSFF